MKDLSYIQIHGKDIVQLDKEEFNDFKVNHKY